MDNEALEILKILIENKETVFSIRKLSKLRKINYKSAYNALMKLRKEGVVNLQKFGNTTSCSFNESFNPSVFIVECERRKELLKNANFKVIYSSLNNISLPFIALLFGSQAKKTSNKYSDIDLMIISQDNKKIEEIISLFPIKIHLISLTPQEFVSMAKSKEFSVVSEAIKKNVIFVGIEDYYRLLENVKRSTNQRS